MLISDRSSGVRVLFTGQYWPGANTVYIARAFERCGVILQWLNETTIWPSWVSRRGRLLRRAILPLIEAEWNRQLLVLLESFSPDLVYITDAHLAWPSTLEVVQRKSIPLMCFYHDVRWKDIPLSRFARNIATFDLVATTRQWQAPEFRSAGAKDVMVTRFGYEPLVHRPLAIEPRVAERYSAQLTFIGTYEAHRSSELESLLAGDFPYAFRLWGNNWDRLAGGSSVNKYWQRRGVYEQEIPVIYATSQIALQWVGWDPHSADPMMNQGDQHNSRTFQIAACGGALMLAQRTPEHLLFFEEDREAVYFDDASDLRGKLDCWLAPDRDSARRQIACAARRRCTQEDYSYIPVVRRYLEYFSFAAGR